MRWMKPIPMAIVAVFVYAIAFWAVFTPGIPNSLLLVPIGLAVFVIPPIGGWWLIYTIIRHEKRVFPIILLAFVPYGFAWYYFDRLRRGNPRSRQLA